MGIAASRRARTQALRAVARHAPSSRSTRTRTSMSMRGKVSRLTALSSTRCINAFVSLSTFSSLEGSPITEKSTSNDARSNCSSLAYLGCAGPCTEAQAHDFPIENLADPEASVTDPISEHITRRRQFASRKSNRFPSN